GDRGRTDGQGAGEFGGGHGAAVGHGQRGEDPRCSALYAHLGQCQREFLDVDTHCLVRGLARFPRRLRPGGHVITLLSTRHYSGRKISEHSESSEFCEISVTSRTWTTASRSPGYASRSDPPSLWTASTSPWPRARCTVSSAPTAPASPPPSGSCWVCCAPTADRWRCSAAIRGGTPPACTAVSPTYPATWPCGPPSAAARSSTCSAGSGAASIRADGPNSSNVSTSTPPRRGVRTRRATGRRWRSWPRSPRTWNC